MRHVMRQVDRQVLRLDPTRPLSAAISQVLCRPVFERDAVTGLNGSAESSSEDPRCNARSGAQFSLGRTMLVVPSGRLARAVERRLLEAARAEGTVLEAPTIVTPLMLFGRCIVPSRPMLSRVGAQASWRETLEQIASTDSALLARVAAAFGSPEELPDRLRPRIAARLAKISAEVASAMHSFASVRAALASKPISGALSGDPRLVEHWEALEACARVRCEVLDAARADDRDDAFRDALWKEVGRAPVGDSAQSTARVASSVGFDRMVILFADPEPVHRALFRVLEARGVSIELCVHRVDEDVASLEVTSVGDASSIDASSIDASSIDVSSSGVGRGAVQSRHGDGLRESVLDREGFPSQKRWAFHTFGTDAIAHTAIRVGEGPSDAAMEVVTALRSIPAPRRSDEIAVMAPDEESRRAIERAIGEVGSRASRVDARVFSATRLGTLLARLESLLGDASMDACAAYIRHPDVARAIGLAGAERDLASYRVATVAESWRDGVVDARGSSGFKAIQDAIAAQVAPLEKARPMNEWARPLRAFLESVVGEDASGAFAEERAQTIHVLDRVLHEFAEVPAAFATAVSCSEVVRLIRTVVDRTEIRGVGREYGISIIPWLDAGIADEPHLILAGFADGVVPEGDVADTLLPDPVRRELGLLSSHRRAARDAWILDGILHRARARRAAGLAASVQFVVPQRSASGDPLRPSRYLLRVEPSSLPARIARLFPSEREREPVVANAGTSIEFPVRPKVDGSVFRTISVTAFRTYLKCPYLFQLQNDPRLRLESLDESAAELDARNFGNLLHEAVEAWGREEVALSKPTTDRDEIERSVLAHLDASMKRVLPARPAPAVRVQIEILRARLRRFAELQVQEAEAGWQVRHVELGFDEHTGPLLLAAAGGSVDPTRGLRLVGRIDRVDQHCETGAWRALDYKTGSAGDTPTATHLKGRKIGAREWKDLQLPLYWYLLAEGRHKISVATDGLGYINLAASAEKSGFRMLECTSGEFEAAFDEARRVVTGVLQGEFAPAPRTPFSSEDPLAAVWGLGLRSQVLGQSDLQGGELGEDGIGAVGTSGGDV